MSRLMLILRLLTVLLEGIAAAYGALLLWHIGLTWYHGGSADPRCVFGWKGYIEVHSYGPTSERVSCQYRPELTKP
jgi:hypothetical protein